MNFETGMPSLPEISGAQASRLPRPRGAGPGPGRRAVLVLGAFRLETHRSQLASAESGASLAFVTHRLAGGLGFPHETLP